MQETVADVVAVMVVVVVQDVHRVHHVLVVQDALTVVLVTVWVHVAVTVHHVVEHVQDVLAVAQVHVKHSV